MNQKQIDELLDLIDRYAAMQGIEPYDAQVDMRDQIEVELRASIRKPLTSKQVEEIDEQALRGVRRNGRRVGYCELFTRAVERAHGIGEPPCEQPS